MAEGPAFYVYKDNAGEYRWRLAAANAETVGDSGEGHTTHAECLAAVERVKRIVRDPNLHLHDDA